MMRPFPSLALLLLIALALPPVPARAEEAAAAETVKPTSLPAITVTEVRMQTLTDRIIASGLIAAVEEVEVVPLIEGQPVEALLAEVGDRVEAGAVLARLSPLTLELQKTEALAALAAAEAAVAQGEAQLVEAQAGAEEAGRVVSRTKTLREKGSAPQSALDAADAAKTGADARVTLATEGLEAARAQLDLAKARLETAELYLGRTEVRAPVAGQVVARNARLGALATAAGAPMFALVRDGALELRADVAEADVLRLAPDMAVRLRAVGQDEPLSGRVRLVEPSVDGLTRLGRARISLDDPGALRPGMFAEAEILVEVRAGLAVPVTALGGSQAQPSVMRVRGGVVETVPVVIGIRDNGLVEITEGLVEGDLIVAKAGAFVREGDRITPVPLPETTK